MMIDINEEIEAQKKSFRFAVFSGGGAKGALYSGAYEEMHKSKVIGNIEAIAGSSAGAITASLIAAGVTPEEFKKVAGNTNFLKLFGGGCKNDFLKFFSAGNKFAAAIENAGDKVAAAIKISNKGFEGKEFEDLMRDTMYKSVSEYLNESDIIETTKAISIDVTNQINKKLLNGDQNDLLSLLDRQNKLENLLKDDAKILKNFQEKIIKNKDSKITFRDLDYLHTIKPERFKGLLLTATEKSENKLELFSIDHNPDTEIALACHASAAFPRVFKPVKIGEKTYVDGGVSSNIPQELFEDYDFDIKKEEPGNKVTKDRILAFCFESDKANISIWSAKDISGPGMIMRLLTNFFLKYIAGISNPDIFHDNEKKTYDNLRENALNAVPLDSKDVGTLSFSKASEKSDYMHISGAIQTRRNFQNYGVAQEDPTLNLKELALQSYDNYVNSDNSSGIFTQKFSSPANNSLLEFCKDEKWEGKDTKEVLKDMIAEFAKGTKSGIFNEKSTGMKSLIKVLNDPQAASKTKKDMMDVLGFDIKSSSTYDPEKNSRENLRNIKFEQRDFIPILQGKTREKRKETNSIERTLEKGKAKSMTEVVQKSKSEAQNKDNSK